MRPQLELSPPHVWVTFPIGVLGIAGVPGVVVVDPAVVGAVLMSNVSGFCADPAVFGASACFFLPGNSLQASWTPYNNKEI